MAYEHKPRGAGDLILSTDWNAIGDEMQRVAGLLEQDEKKESVTLPIPLRVFGKGKPKSPLSVAGGAAIGAAYAEKNAAPANGLIVEGIVGMGTASPEGRLNVVHKEEDANGGAVILGPTAASNLRLGYHKDYTWLQSHAGRPLKVNPLGNDVFLGTQMVVQGDGDVGIGTTSPQAKLQVEGGTRLNGGLAVRDSVQFDNATRQMLNLWGQEYGIGIQDATQYYRTAGHFAWFRGGVHDNATLTAGKGGTAQMVLSDRGFLGVGTAAPSHRLHVVAADEVGLFESSGGQAYLRVSTKEGIENRVELANRPGGRLALWVAGGSDAFNVTRDGNVGIRTITPRTELDVKGVMSGAPNDYMKAQFMLSGGGAVSWEGIGGKLNWTARFIAIAMERGTTFSDGHVNINLPVEIPAAHSYDSKKRSGKDGIPLSHWEALWAVHTVGADPNQVTFRITHYAAATSAPSNWILIGVCNGDDGSLKLGTGQTLPPRSTSGTGQPWTAAPLLNGWTDYGGGYNPAGYYKDPFGRVYLRGLIKNQAAINDYSRHPEPMRSVVRNALMGQFVGWGKPSILQLPEGMRPAYRELQGTLANESIPARIDIAADGQLSLVAGSIEWLTLDGISFRAG